MYSRSIIAGMAAAIALICVVVVLIAALDAQAQERRARVAYVTSETFRDPGVYIWTDSNGCQYVIVRGYNGVAITPRRGGGGSACGA